MICTSALCLGPGLWAHAEGRAQEAEAVHRRGQGRVDPAGRQAVSAVQHAFR